MRKGGDLRAGWEAEMAAQPEKKSKSKSSKEAPEAVDDNDNLFPDGGGEAAPNTHNLFEDSDDDSDDDKGESKPEENKVVQPEATEKDLFGDSSDENSDEELKPSSSNKRGNEDGAGEQEQASKKRKVLEEDGDE